MEKRAFSFGKRFFVSLISLVCSNNAIYLYVLIFFKLFLIETQEKQIKNEKRYFEKNKLQQIITCAMNFWVCFDHLYQFESMISSFYWRFLNIFWKKSSLFCFEVIFLMKKYIFLMPKSRHVKVWWKFGESFTETFSGHVKLSWKFQMKLSPHVWKFHETFISMWKFHESFVKLSIVYESFMKVSWNFLMWLKVSFETFMKVSYAHWKFQWKFHQTFSKLSHAYFLNSKILANTLENFHFFEPKNAFFLGKKAKPSALIPILSETYCFNWINIGIPRLPTGLKYVVVWLKIESSEGAKCT